MATRVGTPRSTTVFKDRTLRQRLTKRGYGSPASIAAAPRRLFVDEASGILSKKESASLHAQLRRETSLLDSVLWGVSGNPQIYGKAIAFDTSAIVPKLCDCGCQAADGPFAYLADLLDYAEAHLRNSGAAVSAAFLVRTFLQPFNDLPLSCDVAESDILQVRICCEVLRQRVRQEWGNLSQTRREMVTAAVSAYYQQAYLDLLSRLGTSYTELRLVRGTDNGREALAGRLGIPARDLDLLVLDLRTVDEETLERLCGLRRTDRDPTSETPPASLPDWQQEYLRARWMATDHPRDQYSAEFQPAGDRLPVIDPDIVGPDDFRNPAPGGNPAFNLWLSRRTWVDAQLNALEGLIVAGTVVPDLSAMFEAMRQPISYGAATATPWAPATPLDAFDALLDELSGGSDPAGARARLWQDLHLGEAEFRFVMDVIGRHGLAVTDPRNVPVPDDDWIDLRSVLVQAQKLAMFPAWLEEERQLEEQQDAVLLGTGVFWHPQSEPAPGHWPPRDARPLVHPERTTLADVAEPRVGRMSIQLWKRRRAELETYRLEMARARAREGFDALLDLTYEGPPPFDVSLLEVELRVDPATAETKIVGGLRLTVEQFVRMMAVKARSEDPGAPLPTSAEWADVAGALESAFLFLKSDAWAIEEGQNTQLVYWRARKARLPRWRASLQSRRAWRAALEARATALVDPDVIGPGDFVDPTDTDAAFALWIARDKWRQIEREALEAGPRTRARFDELLQSTCGLAPADLDTLSGDGPADELPLPQQLDLDDEDVAVLAAERRLLQSGASLLEAEWEQLFSIVLSTRKRQLASDWRLAERTAGVAMSDQFFVLAPNDPAAAADDAIARSNARDRRTWQGDLRGRLEELCAARAALSNAVGGVEAKTLPGLRDALLAAVTPGANLEAQAKWFTGRYLIDARASSCQRTTRVTQAIETLQNMLFAIRTGQLRDDYPHLDLIADDFDTDWRWLGAYAVWRGARQVLLYPENFLLPQLREPRTPAFQHLIDASRRAGRLAPGQAIELVQEYQSYLRDVCSLTPESCCQARARIAPATAQPAVPTDYADRVYLFARGGFTGALYWSVCDPASAVEAAQTFWTRVPLPPGLSIRAIPGVVPYEIDADRRFLYLFVQSTDRRLVVMRFDLDRQAWESESSFDLPLPADVTAGRILASQTFRETTPPQLVLNAGSGVYIRRLNQPGTDWETIPTTFVGPDVDADQWSLFRAQMTPAVYELCGAIDDDYRSCWLVYIGASGRLTVHNPHAGSGPAIDVEAAFEGVLRLKSGWNLLMYRTPDGTSYMRMIGIDGWKFPRKRAYSSVFAPSFGKVADGNARVRLYRSRGDTDGVGRAIIALDSDITGDVSKRDVVRSAPKLADPLRLELCAGAVDVESRWQLTRQVFNDNAGGDGPDGRPRAVGLVPALNHLYLEEALYFVPMYVALQLMAAGQYLHALDWIRLTYDFSRPQGASRKIFYGLERDEGLTASGSLDGLSRDMLNPHVVAAMRPSCYTRFTLLTLVRCLVEFADAEFTADTVESLPRARTLYETALELMGLPEFPPADDCASVLSDVVVEPQWQTAWSNIQQSVRQLGDREQIDRIVPRVKSALAGKAAWATRFARVRTIVAKAREDTPARVPLAERRIARVEAREEAHKELLVHPPLKKLLEPFNGQIPQISDVYDTLTLFTPGGFCVPPNRLVDSLRQRAEVNLHKLRMCRNIAGMERAVDARGDAFMPVTEFRPTLYRFPTIVERAKQLAHLAGQVEAALLAAMEKRDAAAYNLLRATQDVRLNQAGIRVHDLRVREAERSVALADAQLLGSATEFDYYNGLISTGLMKEEINAQDSQGMAAYYLSNTSDAAGQHSAEAAWWATEASYKRRAQDWTLRRAVARQDAAAGVQRSGIARDQARVAQLERGIAVMQARQAEEGAEFLAAKFTNAELYDWMSGVLEQSYRFFLQLATANAQMAARQLAFERQEAVPDFIQSNYWDAPAPDQGTPADGAAPDRKGLTGSTRLLQDIYQLDQYAFETVKRKLQLTRTVSLARFAPIELARFRESGMLRFAPPSELFDRDFPGHYLRLIKRVRVSVIAIVPPAEGIRATLSSTGVARVVVPADGFRTVVTRRPPESVALTAPMNAAGLFDLDMQSDLLYPFENLGVETTWELMMPRASNRFDFRTISDVLLTIDYTALQDDGYRRQVIAQLDPLAAGQRAFSLRRHFADQWYDLHNPEQSDEPMTVRFTTVADDFPANLDDPRIAAVSLYVSGGGDLGADLRLSSDGGPVGGPAVLRDGLISTRGFNGAAWTSMIGKSPFGEWTLSLPGSDAVRDRFRRGDVDDILLSVTYSGRTPEWP